jgi:hypothetical protein
MAAMRGKIRVAANAGAPVRTFATEKQIAMRIVATSNLKKVFFFMFMKYHIYLYYLSSVDHLVHENGICSKDAW